MFTLSFFPLQSLSGKAYGGSGIIELQYPAVAHALFRHLLGSCLAKANSVSGAAAGKDYGVFCGLDIVEIAADLVPAKMPSNGKAQRRPGDQLRWSRWAAEGQSLHAATGSTRRNFQFAPGLRNFESLFAQRLFQFRAIELSSPRQERGPLAVWIVVLFKIWGIEIGPGLLARGQSAATVLMVKGGSRQPAGPEQLTPSGLYGGANLAAAGFEVQCLAVGVGAADETLRL